MATIKRDNVYLYSKRSGRIEVYQGCVRPTSVYSVTNARFIFSRCGKDAYRQCTLEPCVVHNGVVWLPERDDKKAVDLFIEHERSAIQELKDKIERHEWNIKRLMEETPIAK